MDDFYLLVWANYAPYSKDLFHGLILIFYKIISEKLSRIAKLSQL